MKFDKTVISIAISIILLVLILFSIGQYLNIKEIMAIFASGIVTSVGWTVSSYLNHRSFERSEFIKNKDKLSSLTEHFFNELEEILSKRSTTLEDIEDFISNKTTELTLKSTQLQRVFGSKICFLNTSTITLLQNIPIDLFNTDFKKQKEELKKLRISTLEEIDELYETWLKSL